VIKRNRTSLRDDEVEVIANALERRLLPHEEVVPLTSISAPHEDVARACRCGAPMVLRHRRSDGAAFYGCATFPACRHTQPA
jgi:hypothetical protein